MKKAFKRIAAAALAAITACTCLTAFAASEVNLAKGIVPTQNFTASTTGTLSTVTDGKIIDFDGWKLRGDWHASKNPTLTFDLTEPKKIGKVVVIGSTLWQTNSSCKLAANYDISYSTDNSTWTVAAEVRDNASQYSTSEFANIEAQYWSVRVYLSSTDTSYTRISEIEMYEGEDAIATLPEVSMVSERTEADEGKTVTLAATASCEGADVTGVAFYSGSDKLADATLGEDGIWSADISGLAAGEYFVTATATAGDTTATSDSIRVRIHSLGYTNIALHKDSTFTNQQSGAANSDLLVDGIIKENAKPYVWATDSRYNSTKPLGATAWIDLASGFDNEFSIKSVTVRSAYSDAGSEPLSDYTIYYLSDNEWIAAASITGATGLSSYTFPEEFTTSQIKIVSDQETTFRVREIEVYGTLVRKTISKTSTEIVNETGAEIAAFVPGTLVYASATVTNNGTEDADIYAILAVKESDGTLLSVALDNKEAKVGEDTTYSVSTEIPDNAIDARCEVYWLDMSRLASWFKTESFTSR